MTTKGERLILDKISALDKIIETIDVTDTNLPEYYEIREDLIKALDLERESKHFNLKFFKELNINTLVSGGFSLASILLILNYEKEDIITSKAMSIFTKMVGK